MEIKRTTTLELELPKIAGATIPSEKEIVNAECKIKYGNFVPIQSPYFYLRTKGDDDNIKIARGDGDIEEDEPDYIDDDPVILDYTPECGYGNRPELVFEGSLYESGFKPGDEFMIAGYSFTVIGEKTALCNEYISVDIFDEATNNYNKSAIKKRVDKWLKTDILRFI